jgi:hypothetical protein
MRIDVLRKPNLTELNLTLLNLTKCFPNEDGVRSWMRNGGLRKPNLT